jgi:hypothetical protein
MGIMVVVFLVGLFLAASIRDGVDSRPGVAGRQQRWWPGTPS